MAKESKLVFRLLSERGKVKKGEDLEMIGRKRYAISLPEQGASKDQLENYTKARRLMARTIIEYHLDNKGKEVKNIILTYQKDSLGY